MAPVDPLYARIFCIKSFSSAMKKKGYIVFDMKDINFDVKWSAIQTWLEQ